MAQILVRDLEESVVRNLKSRAKRRGHSLQLEVKEILNEAARFCPEEFEAELKKIHAELAGRKFSDSTLLVREDRER